MPAIDHQRPDKLYRYSLRQWLERSLTLGEFRLRPPAGAGKGSLLLPKAADCFLTLSLTQAWHDSLFEQFAEADSCLIIHDTEEFGERIHRAVQKVLPSWTGIDAAVSYGAPSPLGELFSKARAQAAQKEWMFAWRPTQAALSLNPVLVKIGSVEKIAELRGRAAPPGLLHKRGGNLSAGAPILPQTQNISKILTESGTIRKIDTAP
jgi:hypothetical protein